MKKAIGIKSLEPKSDKEIKKYSDKFNIPQEVSYKIDTTSLCNEVVQLSEDKDSLYNGILHDLLQPLQVRAYNNKELSFFMANCYAGGFPNLKWNEQGAFNGNYLNDTIQLKEEYRLKNKGKVFLISEVRSFQEKNTSFDFNLDKDFLKLTPLFHNEEVSLYEDNTEYIIIVYWSIFMNRQSKRLVKYLQDFQKRSSKKVKLYYANIDNIYVTSCVKTGG